MIDIRNPMPRLQSRNRRLAVTVGGEQLAVDGERLARVGEVITLVGDDAFSQFDVNGVSCDRAVFWSWWSLDTSISRK
jgi:hypothetical protein